MEISLKYCKTKLWIFNPLIWQSNFQFLRINSREFPKFPFIKIHDRKVWWKVIEKEESNFHLVWWIDCFNEKYVKLILTGLGESGRQYNWILILSIGSLHCQQFEHWKFWMSVECGRWNDFWCQATFTRKPWTFILKSLIKNR
jgi:hypothetical protein